MNKEKLWLIFASFNPALTDGKMRLDPESVRRLFDTTWNSAYEAGAKDMEDRVREISEDGPTPLMTGTITEFLEALGAKPYAPTKTKKNPKQTDPGV
jgi:hypothetical protein